MRNVNKPDGHLKMMDCGDSRGRILKVKHGYNPNSSSLGSIVFSLPVMLTGISTIFGVAASILFAVVDHPSRRDGFKTLTPEKEPGDGPSHGAGGSV